MGAFVGPSRDRMEGASLELLVLKKSWSRPRFDPPPRPRLPPRPLPPLQGVLLSMFILNQGEKKKERKREREEKRETTKIVLLEFVGR